MAIIVIDFDHFLMEIQDRWIFEIYPMCNIHLERNHYGYALDASFSSEEFYAEILVPILVDKPFAEELSFEGAYRISDYSNTFRFYKLSLVENFINREIVFKSPIGHLNNLLFIIKSGYQIKDIPTSYIETDAESAIRTSSLARYLIEFIKCIIFNKFK